MIRRGESTPEDDVEADARQARQRRIEEIFGGRGPEQTSDDLVDPADRTGGERSDEWWHQQVPPHHG